MDDEKLFKALVLGVLGYLFVKRYFEQREAALNNYPSETRYVGIWQNLQQADNNPGI